MNLDVCIKKTERYLRSDDYSPRLVNVQNPEDLSAFVARFNVGENKFLSVVSYAKKDCGPILEDLYNDLAHLEGNVFVTGLVTWMRLQGDTAVRRELRNIAYQTYNAHIVVLCYQASSFLSFDDIRLKRLVYAIEGDSASLPEIILSPMDFPVPISESCYEGIETIPDIIEKKNSGRIYIKTEKTKENYPYSTLSILEEKDAFTALRNRDKSTNALSPDLGTEDQWLYALNELNKIGSWSDVFKRNFGTSANFSLIANAWTSFDEKQKWLYFIALKMIRDEKNWCLNTAVSNSKSVGQFVRNVYRCLLNIETDDPSFWDKYSEWKNLLKFYGAEKETNDYLQVIKSKEEKAIYYLTDRTKREKERIFELLSEYGDKYTKRDIMEILSHVYPDLYYYLMPYKFKNETLSLYFQDYKFQKVINKIFPEFLDVVEKQAKKREFNFWLSPRAEKIEHLNRKNSMLYFVDAMGVEYLSFILARCKANGMLANVTVCRCELPSITKFNKEFLESFTNIAPDIKRLDDIKHHGEESFNYQNTKLPFHLIRELEIIDDVLQEIHNRLLDGAIDRAYIISDHGASRLAVIYEHENQWEMASRGEHSGRCCPVNEADVQSEYVTESNGFWVLANYDRFKGGRKANVEVHGGASLEEVTVPIIEFTLAPDDYEVTIQSKLPIEVSYRKKAELKIFSKTKLENVTVSVNGVKMTDKFYDAEPLGNNIYLIHMPDLKEKGMYSMTVFSNKNQIAELEFTVEKEGSREKSIL